MPVLYEKCIIAHQPSKTCIMSPVLSCGECGSGKELSLPAAQP